MYTIQWTDQSLGCVPLGWSGSGSVIQDLSGLWSLKEPVNLLPEWIYQFLWGTMIHSDLGSLILIQITPKECTFEVKTWRCTLQIMQSLWKNVWMRHDRFSCYFSLDGNGARFFSQLHGLHSFGVIWITIGDPRSVWIMVHQRNRRIHNQSGFTGSFDAPWSRQILDHWSWSRSPQRNAAMYLHVNQQCETNKQIPVH